MEQEDYKRQVDWLMGEIKDQVSHERSILWTIVGLLFVFGPLAYIYYDSRDFSNVLPYAVLTGVFLVYMVFNRMMHKRILQAATPDELLSVYNILNLGEWIVILVELVPSLSDKNLVGMVFYLVFWIIQKANQKLFNKTELEVNVDRLREIVKEGV